MGLKIAVPKNALEKVGFKEDAVIGKKRLQRP